LTCCGKIAEWERCKKEETMADKQFAQDKKFEAQYAEIVKQLQTSFGPLPDNSSLAQPTPLKVFPTVVTYGAYEEPITG
jgi:hypothetical protein